MDTRGNIIIGVKFITGMENSYYIGFIAISRESMYVIMYQESIKFEYASVIIN